MSINIRYANLSDSALVYSLIRELAEFEGMADQITATEEELTDTIFNKKQASVLIAEYGDRPAGFALFYPVYSTFCGRQNLFLEDLYVRELYRGKGIGKALMRALAGIALQMGAQRLDWYVLEDNKAAESFYRRLGAAPLQDRRTYRMSTKSIESLANGVITNVKNQFNPPGSSD